MTVSAIILAAGTGTRMRSALPKPLHPICGRPMLTHVIHAFSKLSPRQTVVVVGHESDWVARQVTASAPEWANVVFAHQHEQHGTGHATASGMSILDPGDNTDNAVVVVVPGDAPLLTADTLNELVSTHVANNNAATLLTSLRTDPTGYGRIIRAGDDRVMRIVEQGDASPEELDVKEVCTSIYAFQRNLLAPALDDLNTNNSQGEFYLTDVIEGLANHGHRVGVVQTSETETQGVNNRWQLALAERELRRRINMAWMLKGVTMVDPRQTFIDVDVTIGADVTIHPGTVLNGSTTVGDDTILGPHTQLTDCTVGNNCVVAHSVGDGIEIGDGARVGPFAHLTSNIPPTVPQPD